MEGESLAAQGGRMDGSTSPTQYSHNAPRPGSAARISPKLRHAIKLRVENGLTITDACARAGLSEAGWHKALKRPAVLQHIEATELAFIQAAERRFKGYRARAVDVAAELMERGQSEAVRMRAVEFFRGEARGPGVVVQVNTPAPEGYIYRRPDIQSTPIEGQAIDLTGQGTSPE